LTKLGAIGRTETIGTAIKRGLALKGCIRTLGTWLLSRRDFRTQPGVLTPGGDPKRRPALKGRKIPSALVHECIIQSQSSAALQHLQPATRVQFRFGAVLHHSATLTPLFEHEDEHEHEDDFDAPGEGGY
jgi:hypothetical protein